MGRGGSSLDKVQAALERFAFRDAISAAASMPESDLAGGKARPLVEAMMTAAAALWDSSDEELQAYDIVARIGDALPEADRASLQVNLNSALFNRGVVMSLRGKSEEAIAAYDDVVSRAKVSSDPVIRQSMARALFNKGNNLFRLGQHERAINAFDEVVRSFAGDSAPEVREAIGKAMINKAIALAQLGRYEEAIDVFDAVVRGWAESRELPVLERAARALINKATALLHLDRKLDALHTYDEVLERFSHDARAELQEYVDLAIERRQAVSRSLD